MKELKIVFLALMVVLCALTKVSAQNNSSLFNQIENAIKEKAPKWKLTQRRISKSNKYAYYAWRLGKSSAAIFISAHPSLEESTKAFKELPSFFEGDGLKMTVLEMGLQNIGDEYYLWEDYYDKRFTGVDFRKGKVVVHVSASSIETAKRFALQIADEIPAN